MALFEMHQAAFEVGRRTKQAILRDDEIRWNGMDHNSSAEWRKQVEWGSV